MEASREDRSPLLLNRPADSRVNINSEGEKVEKEKKEDGGEGGGGDGGGGEEEEEEDSMDESTRRRRHMGLLPLFLLFLKVDLLFSSFSSFSLSPLIYSFTYALSLFSLLWILQFPLIE